MKKKLLLVVIDALNPAMLERAVMTGAAPILGHLMAQGRYTDACIAPFPSVTPVCAATITTGSELDQHRIPSMNWFDRTEERYVEYGTSFKASRKLGLMRSVTDVVYNLNGRHLARDVETTFERLDDAGIRTAVTNYLIFRGRYEHDVAITAKLSRLINARIGESVMGPKELFYGNLFVSRKTPCRSQFGLPGLRDKHSGCVGAYLVGEDLCDFLLLSLPDNDNYSHRYGPEAQVKPIALADAQIARVAQAVGGIDELLDQYAVIVCSDHGQSPVTESIDLLAALDGFKVNRNIETESQTPDSSEKGEIAVCPGSRSAQVYLLDQDRLEILRKRVSRTLLTLPGVDFIAYTDRGEACVRRGKLELRFKPGGDTLDLGGQDWSIEGDINVLSLTENDGKISSAVYPDALNRLWKALKCETAGDILLSAYPGYEFLDWGGGHHVGGGSHGSLHAIDSRALLLWCGTGPSSVAAKSQWSLKDISNIVLDHFNLKAKQ
jgi:hypothetical protein